MKKHPVPVFIAALLTVTLACALPGSAAPVPTDPNAVNTSIAQTIRARQTEVARSNPATGTFTPSPAPPTETPTATLSPTSEFTATPATPMISVSVDTNCRAGPGAVFERVGMLLVGQTAEIVARELKGEYWYIRNPGNGAEYCWVWGEYATISGNTLTLLIHTPPPPPAGSLSVSFEKLETCNVWWVDFKLVNHTDAVFRSVSITLRDVDTDTVVSLEANGFTNNEPCDPPDTNATLASGGTLTVSSPTLGYDPSKHNLNVKITVCTDVDRRGTCVTQEINFKP